MTTTEIEEFAKALVLMVRDAAIQSNDRTFDGNHVIAKRWKDAATICTPEEFAKIIIPDIVDSTIAHLLGAIDQELLRLSFNASTGNSIDLTTVARESGELTGWHGGSDGWRDKYSRERTIDDFADLNDFFDKPSDSKQNDPK